DGLVVIGVSAPEFSFEKVPANVKNAVKKDGLTYPIALDNNLATWDNYHNEYWPAEYLINRGGQVVRQHFGEGEYNKTEQAIRGLLQQSGGGSPGVKLSGKMMDNSSTGGNPVVAGQTPETYLGANRANAYVGDPQVLPVGSTQSFNFASSLPPDAWSLSGQWQIAGDKITAGGSSKLRINFSAKNVYLVAGSSHPSQVGVSFNGQPISQVGDAGSDVKNSQVTISQSTLYRLASFQKFTSGRLELSVPRGTDLNVFTFGN
ncbi:MAG: cytochrome c biogenesis protein DipZ, partial [Candidatus Saccharimonadales bacterium]